MLTFVVSCLSLSMAIISLLYAYTVFRYTRVAINDVIVKSLQQGRINCFLVIQPITLEFDHVIWCVRYHPANKPTNIKEEFPWWVWQIYNSAKGEIITLSHSLNKIYDSTLDQQKSPCPAATVRISEVSIAISTLIEHTSQLIIPTDNIYHIHYNAKS